MEEKWYWVVIFWWNST